MSPAHISRFPSLTVEYCGGLFAGEVDLEGSKHAFAHSIALLAMGMSGKVQGVSMCGDSIAVIDCLRLIFHHVMLKDRTLTFSCPRKDENLELLPDLLSRSRNIYCLLPAMLWHSRTVLMRGKPKGCEFEWRPDEWYFETLRSFGVLIESYGDAIEMTWTDPRATAVRFPRPTVTASVIAMAAALVCPGTTSIDGIATEPSVLDQIVRLNAVRGVSAARAGRSLEICSEGIPSAYSEASIPPDQEIAVTLLAALALAGGSVKFNTSHVLELERFAPVAAVLGLELEGDDGCFWAYATGSDLAGWVPGKIVAGPHPKPSSDWLPAIAVSLALGGCRCDVELVDLLFADRLKVLSLIGNRIRLPHANWGVGLFDGVRCGYARFSRSSARSYPGGSFHNVSDTRTAAALIISSIRATGPVVLGDTYHLSRAYGNLASTLSAVGSFNIAQG